MWLDHTGNGFPSLNPATLVFVEFRDGERTHRALVSELELVPRG